MIKQLAMPVQAGLRQERKLEVIANHLANANTAGFKADMLSFYQINADSPQNCAGSCPPPCTPEQPCPFPRPVNTVLPELSIDLSQGAFQTTGNKLDLAISEEGFFKINTLQGTRYTRNGNFTVDQNGRLVDQNGNPVQGKGGEIVIEGTDIFINETGEVFVDGASVGIVDVVTFDSPELLQKEGASLFVYTGNPGEERTPPAVFVNQGALEKSNISVVTEMTKMIETQRMFEMYQKMILTFDEMNSKSIEIGSPV